MCSRSRRRSPARSTSARCSGSTVGFVVRDQDRHAFATVDGIRARSPVKIGLTVESPHIEGLLRRSLPGVRIEFVPLSSPREFFSDVAPEVDALALLAESGAAWSVLHPQFAAVVPQPNPIGLALGIAMRRGESDLARFVDDWTIVLRTSGELVQMRQYWILGHGARVPRRRWSVVDDVLGWGRPGGG